MHYTSYFVCNICLLVISQIINKFNFNSYIMASLSSLVVSITMAFLLVASIGSSNAQLTTNFYSKSCPNLLTTVNSVVQSAINKESRMGASLLRLFFHDCFVNVRKIISFPKNRACMHLLCSKILYLNILLHNYKILF